MNPKHRFVALALALSLCTVFPVPAQAENDDVYFTSINDNLLELDESPIFDRGIAYVPSSALSNKNVVRSLDISFEYDKNVGEATISKDGEQITFDISAEKVYDAAGNEKIGVPAITYNGEVYLPAAYICDVFDITYTYIRGNGNGNIVRMNSGALQNDEAFLSAATPLMKSYLNKAATPPPQPPQPPQVPASTAPPATTAVPEPSPTSGQIQILPGRDIDIYISFLGVPDEDTLTLLRQRNITACFFVTAEQAQDDPEMIRRLIVDGQKVGVYCGSDFYEDYELTSSLIFDAARTLTIMVSSDGKTAANCRRLAREHALVYWDSGFEAQESTDISSLLSQIEDSGYREAAVSFICGDNTALLLGVFLNQAAARGADIAAVTETSVIRNP